MSADRELLELAAKAASIPIIPCTCGDERWPFKHNEAASGKYGHWNPLTHDGDALRLAVKLGIEARKSSRSRSVGSVVQAWYPPDGNPRRSSCAHVTVHVKDGDRLAATRRAIVRAAAEIGRSMP